MSKAWVLDFQFNGVWSKIAKKLGCYTFHSQVV